MRVLDLFSGIGGFSLGLERAGMETVAFCEYDEKCRQVLKKHWPDIPQYNDVRTLTGEQLEKDGITDIGLICGGYPCQPFSTAGQRKGQADDRHLWPELFRLVQEIRPTWVLCENVAGHISMGLDSVLADLESEGYSVQAFVIPACAVGAYHRRDRVWIVAHTSGIERRRGAQRRAEGNGEYGFYGEGRFVAHAKCVRRNKLEVEAGNSVRELPFCDGEKGGCVSLADTNRKRRERGNRRDQKGQREAESGQAGSLFRAEIRRPTEPPICRATNGVPGRVDRLKQLGNAVVPQIPEIIGKAIMEAECPAK